jgi:hypothetical protein
MDSGKFTLKKVFCNLFTLIDSAFAMLSGQAATKDVALIKPEHVEHAALFEHLWQD